MFLLTLQGGGFVFRVCHAFLSVHCNLVGKGYPFDSLVCYVFLCFVTFPCSVLGQVWYLIVLIPEVAAIKIFTPATLAVEAKENHPTEMPPPSAPRTQMKISCIHNN